MLSSFSRLTGFTIKASTPTNAVLKLSFASNHDAHFLGEDFLINGKSPVPSLSGKAKSIRATSKADIAEIFSDVSTIFADCETAVSQTSAFFDEVVNGAFIWRR